MKKNLFILIALFLCGILVAFFFRKPAEEFPSPIPLVSSAATSSPPKAVSAHRTPPSGFQEYWSGRAHFSIFYPNGLSVKEYNEKTGGFTVTFQEEKGDKGFQVFATPYSEVQITPERFKMDIPSGVIKNSVHMIIDGAPAEAFFSTNAVLGDTREVWFIHDGFLYEVTSVASLDQWFAEIMKSWKFL